MPHDEPHQPALPDDDIPEGQGPAASPLSGEAKPVVYGEETPFTADYPVILRPVIELDEATRADLEEQRRVQDFVLSFIKAMLRTGYYDPSHPKARTAKQGLYNQFVNLLGDRYEMGFLVKVTQEERDILIDGYWDEPRLLGDIMSKNTGEIFIPKFADYLQRKRLRACAIKRDITVTEFDRFIDIMSGSLQMQRGTPEDDRRALIAILRENRIFSVSIIFEEDMLGGKRRLPWRVELAITRLSKDLATIPMYRDISAERRQIIKLQIFEDIFRPLRRADILAEVLFNIDLIEEILHQIEELEQLDVEQEVIDILPHAMLIMTADELMHDYKSLYLTPRRKFGFEPEVARERTKNILIKIASHIITDKAPEGDRILEALYREGVIRFSELPDHVQRLLRTEKVTEAFLGGPEEFAKSLDEKKDVTSYQAQLDDLELIFNELLKRGKVLPLYEGYKAVREHSRFKSRQFPERQALASAFLDNFRTEANLMKIRGQFSDDDKTLRMVIFEMLGDAGLLGLAPIYDLMVTSENRWIRKSAIRAIVGIGKDTAPFLLHHLVQPGLHWYVYRNILLILSDLGDENVAHEATRFLSHPHEMVRVEALNVLVKMKGSEAADYLLQALDDVHPEVVRRALFQLGVINCRAPKLIERIEQILFSDSKATDDVLQVHAIMAVGAMGKGPFSKGRTTEQVIIDAIEQGDQGGWFKRLKQLKSNKSNRVLRTAAETLGVIGSKEARSILTRLSKLKDTEVAEQAGAALERLSSDA